MYKYFLITCFIMLALGPPGTKAEKAYTPPVNCLRLYWENDIWFNNPDSIMVDICTNSPTNGEYYAKQFFWVQFKYNELPRLFKTTNYDTIVEYSWQDIDPIYNETRIGFNQIEKKYGKFWFREVNLWVPDTTSKSKRQFKLRFGNIVNIDSMKSEISNIFLVHDNDYIWNAFAGVTRSNNEGKSIVIFPMPADNILHINFQNKNFISDNYDVEIYTFDGRKIKKINITGLTTTLDISDLPASIYFLKIGSIFESFIISR